MKKIIIVLVSTLFYICAMTSKAQESSATDQYPLLTEIVTETKKTNTLPQTIDEGVIWQDIYTDKNKLVYEYVMQHDSEKANASKLEAIADAMLKEVFCDHDAVTLKALTDINTIMVMTFKFNDKTFSFEKSVSNCPGANSNSISSTTTTTTTTSSSASTDYASQTIDGINFSEKNLIRANFTNTEIGNTNFQGANLTQGNFTNAELETVDMKNTNLTQCNLTNAELKNVDLRNANLTQCNLTNVELENVDLRNAVLVQANLLNVEFKNTKLGGAMWVDGTVCPENSIDSCK